MEWTEPYSAKLANVGKFGNQPRKKGGHFRLLPTFPAF
jgi:hypothetical protein